MQTGDTSWIEKVCNKARKAKYWAILESLGLGHDCLDMDAARLKIYDYCRDEHARRIALHGRLSRARRDVKRRVLLDECRYNDARTVSFS